MDCNITTKYLILQSQKIGGGSVNGKVIAGGDIFGLKWGTAQSPQMKTICAVAYGRPVWQLEGITRGFRLRTITRTNSLTTSRWFFFLESNSWLTTAAQTDDLRWNDEAELSKWKRRSFQRVRRREDIRTYENTNNKENKNKKIRKRWYGQKRKNILVSFETLLILISIWTFET